MDAPQARAGSVNGEKGMPDKVRGQGGVRLRTRTGLRVASHMFNLECFLVIISDSSSNRTGFHNPRRDHIVQFYR